MKNPRQQIKYTEKVFKNSSKSLRNYFLQKDKRDKKLHKERLSVYRLMADFVGRKRGEQQTQQTSGSLSKLFGLGAAGGAGLLGRQLFRGRGTRPRITGQQGLRNPFRSRPQVTGMRPPTGGGARITGNVLPTKPVLPKGISRLKPSGVPVLGIAMTGLDYADRLSQGQTQTQAAAGSVATTLGGVASAKAAAVALSPLLVTPIPGARVIYGLGVLGAGLVGAFGTQQLTDKLTGADKALPKQEEDADLDAKLDRLLEAQRNAEPAESPTARKFSRTLDTFDRIVAKFEKLEFPKQKEREIKIDTEGYTKDPLPKPKPSVTPMDGYFPLPGGVTSTRDTGFPGGEFGAGRDDDGDGIPDRSHAGQDIGGLPPGSPVIAYKDGELTVVGQDRYGQDIIEIDHGEGLKTRYLHVLADVQNGPVVAGQQIGKLGPPTKSWVEHLHFEILDNGTPIDPLPHLEGARRVSTPIEPIEEPKRQAFEPIESREFQYAKLNTENIPVFLPITGGGEPQMVPQIAIAPTNAPVIMQNGGLTHGQLFALSLDRFA